MKSLIGYIIVIGSVFGGFYLANGPMHILMQPIEFLIILGCAFGAFVIATPGALIKDTGKEFVGLFKANKYNKETYIQGLMLMHDLLLVFKEGGSVKLEKHIEDVSGSDIFTKYPKISNDHHLTDFIVDNMRLVTMNRFEAHAIESYIEEEIEQHSKHGKEVSHALQAVSDALPGLGIVAAVLGIIITMQHLDGSNAEIGHHIGVALVGTFAGLLFSYGFVGPAASAIAHKVEDEKHMFQVFKVFIVAILTKYPPEIAAEIARKYMPTHCKPDFQEIESLTKESKAAIKQAGKKG